MPVRTHVDARSGCAMHVVSGVVRAHELREALEEIHAHTGFQPEAGGIWDLRAADASALRASELRELAAFILERQGRRPGRTAIVVSRDVEYGLGRMYEVFSESVLEARVFRDWDEALAWVRGKRSDADGGPGAR